MSQLNYHHLRYFHAIVREGTLTAAAERLNVAQSALSVQLKQLEQNLGVPLFERKHKSLQLTEEGRIVYNYAQTIFQAGEEMMATLQNSGDRYKEVLRVGAVATLSRNFQLSFLHEVIDDERVEVVIHSASMSELLDQLEGHDLDLVLSNRPVQREGDSRLQSYLVDEQPVSLVGGQSFRKRRKFRFPEDLKDTPLVLPTRESGIRMRFDLILQQHGIVPLIAAEADDMAMLRLLAREVGGVSLLPPVVVYEELVNEELYELCQVPNLYERFYAMTVTRRFPNPHVEELIKRTKTPAD